MENPARHKEVSPYYNSNLWRERIPLLTSSGYIFININEIIKCESIKNNTLFLCLNKIELTAYKNLREYEAILINYGFIRIHQSHLINPNRILKFLREGYVIMEDNSAVGISRRKKAEFIEILRDSGFIPTKC